MNRASSTALHSWRTTRLARRVSSANAVARIKRPATTAPTTDDIRMPDLQLSHFMALERSSMKMLHLEPLSLSGYPPASLPSPLSRQSASKCLQHPGEPKSDARVPQRATPAPNLPSPSDPATNPSHHLLSQTSSSFEPAYGLERIEASDTIEVVEESKSSSPVRRHFYHNHLTEAIRKRRVASAWHIYEAQKNRTRKDGTRGGRSVPTGLVHSLFALLAGAHPQTRLHYVRMRELVDVLRRRGRENMREWEWNALINAAGRGFRKTTPEDYRAATKVLEEWEADMRVLKEACCSVKTVPDADGFSDSAPSGPSIRTYNILLAIAAQTCRRSLYEDALRRLASFNGRPDAVTYLARITHHRKNGHLHQIPPLLEQMVEDGWPLQIDGVNAVIWAYASNGQLDIAQQIYNSMPTNTPTSSHQLSPSASPGHSSSDNPILSIPSLFQSIRDVRPDHRTYVMMIQAYAQIGELAPALDILQDYLTAISTAHDPSRSLPKAALVKSGDKHVMPAFRGLFLGFVKYGTATTQNPIKRALAGMSLKDAASALLLDLAPTRDCSTKHGQNPGASQYTTDTLLSLFRFYVVLTSSYISEANHPIPLPPPQFIRTILLAFKNTVAPEMAPSLLNDVWRTIVSERLEPCGRKWLNQRDAWTWTKVRRDFGVNERTR